MTQKALLVAVGDYQNYATQLDAPKDDVLLWRAILESYGFSDIRQRIDSEAKRGIVVEDLEWLFKGARKDDQLVFVFLGHGRLVDAHAGASELYEEALIVYPDGDSTLKSAEITDSDVTKIIVDAELRENVDAAIGVDACFAGYFDVPVPEGAKLLFIRPVSERGFTTENVRAFGSFGEDSESTVGRFAIRADKVERPIVVAACGRTEGAYQLPIDGVPHMIFTFRATRYLAEAIGQDRDVTFDMLVQDIRPLEEGVPQTPEIRGNKRRGIEKFPGEPAPSKQMAADAFARAATVVSVKTLLDIRFEGIGCFAAARDLTDPYRKRLLFPYDSRVDPNRKHLTFIEIPEDHVDSYTGTIQPKKGPHTHDPTVYYRWELRGHVIRVTNTDNTQPFITTAGFEKHVPNMIEVYPPFATTQYHPRAECFLPNPGTNLMDAYFDLTAGTLGIGPLDQRPTVFKPNSGPVTHTILACRNTTLRLLVNDEVATIAVTPFGGGGAVATIKVKRGGKVRIGNAREGDIMEDGSAEDPGEHFNLYYNLSKPRPADPSLPQPSGVPVNFCSQTGWP